MFGLFYGLNQFMDKLCYDFNVVSLFEWNGRNNLHDELHTHGDVVRRIHVMIRKEWFVFFSLVS